MDAIILAGGLGTRLQSALPHLPKALAPIKGRPFLDILLHKLSLSGLISRVILALGFRSEMIKSYYQSHSFPFPILFSLEDVPQGTGGALRLALEQSESEDLLVLNGDTFLDFSLPDFVTFHKEKGGVASLIVLSPPEENRYGNITLGNNQEILSFEEKQGKGEVINGGIYLLKKQSFLSFPLHIPFSLEREGFPQLLEKGVFGYTLETFFIDIGTPHSYERAQKCLF